MRRTLIQILLLCCLGSALILHGPLEPAGTGERLALALLWLGGLFLAGWRAHNHLLAQRQAKRSSTGN